MELNIQRGQQWLEKLLQLMGMPTEVAVGTVETPQADLNACWLIINEANLAPKQIEILIGQNGEGIDAIQYLANTLLNLGVE
ncbi:MAG: RNA-binding protein, partial [Microcystaceae cyanobacterium]